MEEYAIEVKNLKIRYRCLNKISIKKSLFHMKKSNTEVFEALHGVSFNVKPGEIVGIIGKNGSGKSTMLRAIGGIFSADEGTIDLHGHSISLLSIGVGFQKKLTGRENILLSGMVLGFEEDYIRERMNDIIEFSELGDFIDNPVRTYSSGMYMRLAFSIAINVDAEILLIDEILAVGDQHFQDKCFAKLKEMKESEKTIVIVTHSLGQVRELCNRAIWIYNGEVRMDGTPNEVVDEYLKVCQ